MSKVAASATILALLLVVVHISEARPSQYLSRPKRVSDQRLAELETLLSLKKMGRLINVPIGYGKIDPDKLGRKRRSSSLAENHFLELRRVLRSVVFDNVELSPRDRSLLVEFLSSQWDATDQEKESASAEDEGQYY